MHAESFVATKLDELREAIALAVDAASLTDHLTGLGNQRSLENWLDFVVAEGQAFSLAFLEVDHFKRTNDKFGYADADRLLGAIGELLRAAQGKQPAAIAFRAHGDEFYFGLLHEPTDVRTDEFASIVDTLRLDISAIRLEKNGEEMTCTVSVGWWTPALLGTEDAYDGRYVLDRLQRTVDEAKRTRNCTLKYHPDVDSRRYANWRGSCGACAVKVSIDFDSTRHGGLTAPCPACRNRIQ